MLEGLMTSELPTLFFHSLYVFFSLFPVSYKVKLFSRAWLHGHALLFFLINSECKYIENSAAI